MVAISLTGTTGLLRISTSALILRYAFLDFVFTLCQVGLSSLSSLLYVDLIEADAMRAEERNGGGRLSLRLLGGGLVEGLDIVLGNCLYRMPSSCRWLLLRRMFAYLSSSMSAILAVSTFGQVILLWGFDDGVNMHELNSARLIFIKKYSSKDAKRMDCPEDHYVNAETPPQGHVDQTPLTFTSQNVCPFCLRNNLSTHSLSESHLNHVAVFLEVHFPFEL